VIKYSAEGFYLKQKMKYLSSRIRILVLIGALFLSVSFVYAETAEELEYAVKLEFLNTLKKALDRNK